MGERRAYLLSLSAIADDPRVRRMGDALHAAGWAVKGVGLPGAQAEPPLWPIGIIDREVSESSATDGPAMIDKLWFLVVRAAAAISLPFTAVLRRLRLPAASTMEAMRARAWNDPHSAADALRRWPSYRRRGQGVATAVELWAAFWRLWPEAERLKQAALSESGPALWIANDWTALPAAVAAAEKNGGCVAYDSHELATEEYAELPHWRRYRRPVVSEIERSCIVHARVVSAVSPGIARHLTGAYGLRPAALTLRNTPHWRETSFRPTGENIRLLYHGVIGPGRGLRECVEALADLPDTVTLTLRGPVRSAELVSDLLRTSKALRLERRLSIEPPVPMTQLVERASEFDIGLMALPGHSLHNREALPNKLFEYMMAGLALAVSDLPAMAGLVNETGAGVLFPMVSAAQIADVLRRLTPTTIDRCKQASLAAARRYCWERESAPVLDAYATALEAPGGA